jgi:hypothetical protein
LGENLPNDFSLFEAIPIFEEVPQKFFRRKGFEFVEKFSGKKKEIF